MYNRRPPGWVQINFPTPPPWKDAAKRLQEQTKQRGEIISFEEACRRLYKRGAEVEGVWVEESTER